jgi:hypothetical protein
MKGMKAMGLSQLAKNKLDSKKPSSAQVAQQYADRTFGTQPDADTDIVVARQNSRFLDVPMGYRIPNLSVYKVTKAELVTLVVMEKEVKGSQWIQCPNQAEVLAAHHQQKMEAMIVKEAEMEHSEEEFVRNRAIMFESAAWTKDQMIHLFVIKGSMVKFNPIPSIKWSYANWDDVATKYSSGSPAKKAEIINAVQLLLAARINSFFARRFQSLLVCGLRLNDNWIAGSKEYKTMPAAKVECFLDDAVTEVLFELEKGDTSFPRFDFMSRYIEVKEPAAENKPVTVIFNYEKYMRETIPYSVSYESGSTYSSTMSTLLKRLTALLRNYYYYKIVPSKVTDDWGHFIETHGCVKRRISLFDVIGTSIDKKTTFPILEGVVIPVAVEDSRPAEEELDFNLG